MFSEKTKSCLLKNTERTRKYSLHQFSTKLTCAELVKTRALLAGDTLRMCASCYVNERVQENEGVDQLQACFRIFFFQGRYNSLYVLYLVGAGRYAARSLQGGQPCVLIQLACVGLRVSTMNSHGCFSIIIICCQMIIMCIRTSIIYHYNYWQIFRNVYYSPRTRHRALPRTTYLKFLLTSVTMWLIWGVFHNQHCIGGGGGAATHPDFRVPVL